MVIDLEVSENTTRLAGKDISEFTERISSLMRGLVLTTVCADSQKVAEELNSVLKNGGRTKIMLELLLEKHKVSILLPGAYSITPQVIYEISHLSWIKGVEINTNNLLI